MPNTLSQYIRSIPKHLIELTSFVANATIVTIWGRRNIMNTIARTILAAAGAACLIGSAHAADMTGAEIKTFLSNKTAYLETTSASASGVAGQVVIYWSADGTALYRTPSG